jgi:aerobic carbon-monoxide dehydrogenase large subunit
MSRIGDAPKRREDQRFVTGAGAYLDVMAFDGLSHAAFVRSPHAHARISGIDTAAAKAMPGVLAVLTAEDAVADGLKPLVPFVTANTVTDEPLAWDAQPLLAEHTVRFVGEPIAMVIAETKTQALDAAEAVAASYVPLPAVTDGRAALTTGAVEISTDIPGNLCMDWRYGDQAAVERAEAASASTVSISLMNHRIVTNPMEPRGGVGVFDAGTGRYTLHVSSQNIHINRDHIATALGVGREAVRWLAPDVGGGFGAKNFAYVEQALLLWAARRAGRPVKCIASRSEVFLADHQARDHWAEVSLAVMPDGQFAALVIDSIANLGAYMAGSAGGVQTNQYAHLPGTLYAIPDVGLRVRSVVTNTAPIGVTRGPGFGEMNNIIERVIDAAAAKFGMDAMDLRRKNLITPSAMPATNPLGGTVDSGDFPKAFEAALKAADYSGLPSRKAATAAPFLRGFGIANHIKATGGVPDENVEILFRADGGVDLITGTQTIGQGHETTFPQLVAERLGVPSDVVTMRHGDTDAIINGGGHGSSRATYMAGTAIWRASEEIEAKGKSVAADMLEAAATDITFTEGQFTVAGTNCSVGILDVAKVALEAGTPLDTFHAFTREAMTYPCGAHAAEVTVDQDTGVVRLVNYTAVDDYGVLVNPMVASGQVHGAIAQGVGQALLEHAVYDEDGQLLAGSFMDYAMPRADDLPSFTLDFSPTSCTTNPLGVKGCGEAGAIAGYPAVTLAILDALKPFGVEGWDGPATPETIWQAIQAARSA